MKTIFGFFMSVFLVGCGTPPSAVKPILGGEHNLRKMTERNGVDLSVSGGFFLVSGEVSVTQKTQTLIKFAWELNDGTYAISSLPLEKIRIKIDNNVTVPTISFSWEENYYKHQIQDLMDCCVDYALITIKESDWPIQVNLPLNY